MRPILKLSPITRINDEFDHRGIIDATPVNFDVYHPTVKGMPNESRYRYQADFYQQIACDIVVETVFDYPYPYITEKTFRSLACKRMFVLVAPSGCLLLLKKLGFQTFEDIIDESYDSIKDAHDRYNCVIDAVKRFCQLPLDEVKTYMAKHSDKFEHNFQTLISMEQQQLRDLSNKLDKL